MRLDTILSKARGVMTVPGTTDRHLKVPAQEKVAEELLRYLDGFYIPFEVLMSHEKTKRFFVEENGSFFFLKGKKDNCANFKEQPVQTPIKDLCVEELGNSGEKGNTVYLYNTEGFYDVKSLLDAGSAARERLTLRKHTQMVIIDLMQRLNYFLPNATDQVKDFMIITMMLHDIGKSLATALGDKNWQHELSVPIIEYLGTKLELSTFDIKLLCAMVDHDAYGKIVFKNVYPNNRTIQESQAMLREYYKNLGDGWISEEDFITLTRVYFTVDGFGGYGFVRAVTGYVRKGAIIAEGPNAGTPFYQLMSKAIIDERVMSNKFFKSEEVAKQLEKGVIPDEVTLLNWLSLGKLRLSEFVSGKILTHFDLYFNEPTIDQEVHVDYIADHEESAKFVYDTVPPLPRFWIQLNDAAFWGPLSGGSCIE